MSVSLLDMELYEIICYFPLQTSEGELVDLLHQEYTHIRDDTDEIRHQLGRLVHKVSEIILPDAEEDAFFAGHECHGQGILFRKKEGRGNDSPEG